MGTLVRHPALAIIGLALLLTVPAFVGPPMTHDSFWIDWVWADQFAAELGRGNFYPRWLPQSHGGLGSPVFYFYPPLGFHAAGLFAVAGLSTYAAIVMAFGAALAASGFAMFAWLKDQVRHPLVGTLAFMAAPYHVLDFYGRGALAEYFGIAFLPLVALGLKRAQQGRPALLVIAYAGLILSHLPLALLTSLFLILPWAVMQGIKSAARTGALLAVGIAIAAIYLVPALALDSYRDSVSLWNQSGFNPETWSLWNWSAPGPLPDARVIAAGVLVSLVPAAILLMLTSERRWGAYAGACLALGAGLVPFLWSLPLLSSVQFPFRILPLAEFAIATGLASLDWRQLRFWLVITPALSVSVVSIAKHPPQHAAIAVLARSHPDVPENLPPGERPYSWPSEWALKVARDHPRPVERDGITLDRLFYFPAWEVRCQGRAVPTRPDPATKLLTYRGSRCERRLRMTTAEKAGAAISLVGLLLLIGLAAAARRRERRRARG